MSISSTEDVNQTEQIWTGAKVRRVVLQILLITALCFAAAYLVYLLSRIILLLALTVLFCYLLAPAVAFFESPSSLLRRPVQFPRWMAVTAVYLICLAAISIGGTIIVPRLGAEIATLAKKTPEYMDRVDGYFKELNASPQARYLPQQLKDVLNDGTNQIFAKAGDWIRLIAVDVAQLSVYVSWLILIPVIGFFFLKDGGLFYAKLVSSVSEHDKRRRVARLLNDISNALASYIKAQLTASILVGTLTTIVFLVLGVPYAILLGVSAALLEFLPLIGPFTLLVAATLIAGLQSLRLGIVVFGFLLLLRGVEDYVIYPKLISREVELHPVVVILAILCGAELGGVLGVIFSVPVTALAIVAWKHWRTFRDSLIP